LPKGSVVRHSKIDPPMTALGQSRQIDTPAKRAQCPLHLQERPNMGIAAKRRDGQVWGPGPGAKDCGRSLAPLQSRTDSEVISPTAMAGGNTGLVLCQVGGQ